MDNFFCRVMLLWKKFMSHANPRALNVLETISVNEEPTFKFNASSFILFLKIYSSMGPSTRLFACNKEPSNRHWLNNWVRSVFRPENI